MLADDGLRKLDLPTPFRPMMAVTFPTSAVSDT